MGQAGQQQDHLLGFPLPLPVGHQSQGLFILTKGGLNHGAAIIGIGQHGGLQVGQGRHQHGVLIPTLLFRGPNDPLWGRATEAMGM